MNYYITAVEYGNTPRMHIANVLLHEIDGLGNFLKGRKVDKNYVIALLTQNDVRTARWSYTTKQWVSGAKVEVENSGGNYYLRTNHNAKVEDNLENCPLLPLWL